MGTLGSARHGSLPFELSTFVGRRAQLVEVGRLLARARLVTLTGVGGVGKSRLALRVAHRLERSFPDGVWLVELAPLNEPSLVPMAVARSLQIADAQADEPARQLVDHLRGRRQLLVLDNCEHLLSACAGLVTMLLESCPELRVMATSREQLRTAGEAVYQVPPLSLPHQAGVDGRGPASEAVSLFLERAQASVPGFQLTAANHDTVVHLCRCLDGIPLAIELAAVRLRALSVEEIVERLESQLDLPSHTEYGRPPRQQTLRATMDWSHELLEEPERLLWRRLSVFAGGFELEAAEAVCPGRGLSRPQVLDALVRLVERSIVLREDAGTRTRYRLLEIVQQYGRSRLSAGGEERQFRLRQRDWCGHLARAAAERWWGPSQRELLDRLQAEHDNLRAALACCLEEPGEAAAGLAICADTWFFWNAQHHLHEGHRWMSALLDRSPEPSRERAATLVVIGTLMLLLNDAAAAGLVLEEAAALGRRLRAPVTTALALGRLSSVAAAQGDLHLAVRHGDEAVRLARELDDAPSLAMVLSQRARIALGQRDVERALTLYGECVDLCEAAGEQWLRQRAILPLAIALSDMGNQERSRSLLRESLSIARDLNDRRMMTWSLEGLAWTRSASGGAEEAAALLGAAGAMRAGEPASQYAFDRQRTERCRAAAVESLGQEAFHRAWERGAAMDPIRVVAMVLGETRGTPRSGQRSLESPLSPREREVALLVAEGLSNRAIADRLFISVRTAENHVNRMLLKLGLRSRAQLATWVAEHLR